ncbi:MAG: transposase family protein [Deltaproteobacteria bacterium]|nr:transposase family protein [Deltaproteobacteria bacterium]
MHRGEQAQVDWAQVGELNVAGGKRKLWLFIMTLSWSRASWGELVFDLTADSLQRSLARAAEYFGGNTRQWLFECASLPLGQSAHHRHCSAW